MDTNSNSQFVELVDHSESKYEIDLPKDSFLDKKVTVELRSRERNVKQARFDSQNQGRHSENTEESENTRLRNASGNRERNSRIGQWYPSRPLSQNPSLNFCK
ncbi:hypothetical protein GcM1_138004 [Golovinomyces cichoracearum]|uniref:Uncharacterized protein n=1 Tax=Golovinomyces cichoracearum TaxID=62708 RepID=A0A420JBP2_9PEZI|nr:hypothetical protein GcM1_138004 [Golovinomyces cichoracearum]